MRWVGMRVPFLRFRFASNHAERGDAHAKAGEWPAAANAYRAALAWDDHVADWHARLGHVATRSEDWPAAAASYQEAIARDDSSALWHYRLGVSRTKMTDWSGAAAAYEAAIARDDTTALWHYRLACAKAELQDWSGAAAAYEAAIARDDTRAAWHFRLGLARKRLNDWAGAAAACAAALERQPDKGGYRHSLAVYLANDGKEPEARAVLAPTLPANDAALARFLSLRGLDATTGRVDSTILFVPGARTCSTRRIAVEYQDRTEVYFEHRISSTASGIRRRDFYAAMERAFGAGAPDFVPRLHHSEIGESSAYFLYDYVAPSIGGHAVHLANGHDIDFERAAAVVDGLSEIFTRLGALFDETPLVVANARVQRGDDLSAHLTNTLRNARLPDDDVAALGALKKRWSRHKARYESLPQTFVHGNINADNVLLDPNGNVRIVDWEAWGQGPLGFDLIAFFEGSLASDAFEVLAERYFDAVAPRFSPAERRYTIALLAVMWALSRNLPLPKKWLHHLAQH
jgi:tetratricopeptide (TPR) repeat protein